MSVNTVNNRQALGSFRTTLNTWAAAINTLITGLAAAVADIATNTTDISNKQDKDAVSTLIGRYRTITNSDTLANTDVNAIIRMTDSGATQFNLPATTSIPKFVAGAGFWLYNSAASTNPVTLTNGGSSITGTPDVTAGTSAYVICIGSNAFLRLV